MIKLFCIFVIENNYPNIKMKPEKLDKNGPKTAITALLATHQLRQTDCRLDILEVFLEKKFALSHSDLEKMFKENYDRVTMYRTLKSFLDKGLIHKVLDDEGTPKYALCSASQCTTHTHAHEHVHFKCETCGQTSCLDEIKVPSLVLPKGFQLKEMNLLLQGICASCQIN